MKAPFPYFGGKSIVASDVWSALGDCAHYIEPFCGSCAVLLNRPSWHKGSIETVNDADGHIANVWRALQWNPDEVAKWCDWPVNHADLIARKRKLNLNTDVLLEKLCASPDYYDAKLAGYYVWSASCWIGSGLICPNQTPHLSDSGTGVHAKGKIPHICNGGKSVHKKSMMAEESDPTKDVRAPYELRVYAWFRALSERLRRVRVVCGDWRRVCGGNWQNDKGPCGMFFDPPYSEVATRTKDCYAVDSQSVAHDVRAWCLERGNEQDYRIVLAGYYEEHESLLDRGWDVRRWSAQGGYANLGKEETKGKTNRHREALFFSPHCVKQETLWTINAEG